MSVRVSDITGEFATDTESGQTLYSSIYSQLISGEAVELDFEGVTVVASAFFNFAIGQLLGDFTPNFLNERLTIVNLSTDGRHILQRVIKNAKHYYSDQHYRQAVDAVMEDYAASF